MKTTKKQKKCHITKNAIFTLLFDINKKHKYCDTDADIYDIHKVFKYIIINKYLLAIPMTRLDMQRQECTLKVYYKRTWRFKRNLQVQKK